MTYYSQAGQDKWVYETVGSSGMFVDIGAYDGIQTSNTYLLERLGWKGICIEANPYAYQQLNTNRKCICVPFAVTDYDGMCSFGTDRIGGHTQVECYKLDTILKGCISPTVIDYMSLDIEGHELTVLKAFDFDRWDVKLMTVEHNLYCDGPEKKIALYELLTEKGYIRTHEDVKCLDPNPLYFNQPFEDWYQKI